METPDWHASFFPPTHLNNKLPAIFDRQRITNSYKFFWFLAILDFVERADSYEIGIDELVTDMVAQVWYPVNVFRLNLGKADKLADAVRLVREASGLKEMAKPDQVRKAIAEVRDQPAIRKRLRELGRFVPYRLLSVWFSEELKGISGTRNHHKTVELAGTASQNQETAPLYHFSGPKLDRIYLSYHWFWYLRDHLKIIRQFTYHQLLDYLQRRNPNTPNLLDKLHQPVRRSLSKPRNLWKQYIAQHPDTTCIFTQQPIDKISVDHFLPWSFVAHDQLWNLIPVNKSTNSQKGNRLPARALVPPFARLQHHFLQDLYHRKPRHQSLEDYASAYRSDPAELAGMTLPTFENQVGELILPQMTIARNMGFLDW